MSSALKHESFASHLASHNDQEGFRIASRHPSEPDNAQKMAPSAQFYQENISSNHCADPNVKKRIPAQEESKMSIVEDTQLVDVELHTQPTDQYFDDCSSQDPIQTIETGTISDSEFVVDASISMFTKESIVQPEVPVFNPFKMNPNRKVISASQKGTNLTAVRQERNNVQTGDAKAAHQEFHVDAILSNLPSRSSRRYIDSDIIKPQAILGFETVNGLPYGESQIENQNYDRRVEHFQPPMPACSSDTRVQPPTMVSSQSVPENSKPRPPFGDAETLPTSKKYLGNCSIEVPAHSQLCLSQNPAQPQTKIKHLCVNDLVQPNKSAKRLHSFTGTNILLGSIGDLVKAPDIPDLPSNNPKEAIEQVESELPETLCQELCDGMRLQDRSQSPTSDARLSGRATKSKESSTIVDGQTISMEQDSSTKFLSDQESISPDEVSMQAQPKSYTRDAVRHVSDKYLMTRPMTSVQIQPQTLAPTSMRGSQAFKVTKTKSLHTREHQLPKSAVVPRGNNSSPVNFRSMPKSLDMLRYLEQMILAERKEKEESYQMIEKQVIHIDDLNFQKFTLQKNINELIESNDRKDGQIKTFTGKAEKYKQHANDLVLAQRSLHEDQQEFHTLRMNSAKEKQQELLNEMERLRLEFGHTLDISVRTKELLKEAKQKHADHEKAIEVLKRELNDCVKELSRAQGATQDLQVKLREKGSMEKEFKSLLNEHEAKILEQLVDHSGRITAMLDAEDENQKKLDECLKLIAALKDKESKPPPEFHELMIVVENLSARVDSRTQATEDSSTSFRAAGDEVIKDLQHHLRTFTTNQEAEAKLKEIITTLRETNASLSQKVLGHETRGNELQKHVESTRNDLAAWQRELNARSDDVKALQLQHREDTVLHQQAEELRKSVVSLNGKLETALLQSEQARGDLFLCQESYKSVVENLRQVTEELQASEQKSSALEQEKSTHETSTEVACVRLRTDLEIAFASKLATEKAKQDQMTSTYQRRQASAEDKLKVQQDEIFKLREQETAQKTELGRLQAENVTLRESQQKHATEISSLEERICSVEERLTSASSELQLRSEELNQSKRSIQQYDAKVSQNTLSAEIFRKVTEDKLGEIKNSIRDMLSTQEAALKIERQEMMENIYAIGCALRKTGLINDTAPTEQWASAIEATFPLDVVALMEYSGISNRKAESDFTGLKENCMNQHIHQNDDSAIQSQPIEQALSGQEMEHCSPNPESTIEKMVSTPLTIDPRNLILDNRKEPETRPILPVGSRMGAQTQSHTPPMLDQRAGLHDKTPTGIRRQNNKKLKPNSLLKSPRNLHNQIEAFISEYEAGSGDELSQDQPVAVLRPNRHIAERKRAVAKFVPVPKNAVIEMKEERTHTMRRTFNFREPGPETCRAALQESEVLAVPSTPALPKDKLGEEQESSDLSDIESIVAFTQNHPDEDHTSFLSHWRDLKENQQNHRGGTARDGNNTDIVKPVEHRSARPLRRSLSIKKVNQTLDDEYQSQVQQHSLAHSRVSRVEKSKPRSILKRSDYVPTAGDSNLSSSSSAKQQDNFSPLPLGPKTSGIGINKSISSVRPSKNPYKRIAFGHSKDPTTIVGRKPSTYEEQMPKYGERDVFEILSPGGASAFQGTQQNHMKRTSSLAEPHGSTRPSKLSRVSFGRRMATSSVQVMQDSQPHHKLR